MPDNYISQIDFGDGVVRKLKADGGGGSLSELSDVNLTNPSSEQIIKYNATTQKWENSDLPLIVITNIPSTSDSFTYDGTVKTPTWANYSANQLLIGGDVSATNAGTHTTTFTPKAGFCWDDYSTTPKSVTWTIAKATGSITLDKNSVTLNPSNLSDTVTIINATGTASVSSSDSTVVSASLSGDVITVTAVNTNANKDTTITVNVAESNNYLATSVTFTVATIFIRIYGAEWDGTSTTAWTRTDDAAEFEDPVPAVNNGDGSSPFDNIMPWAGMVRINDAEAGILVSIPKFYYKWTLNGAKMKLQLAAGPERGFLVSPAHADRGDGAGERDIVYVGAYPCDTGTYKSVTHVTAKRNLSRSSFRTNIHNIGSTIWQWDYAMYWTIMMLYLVEYANWDAQRVIGLGDSSNSVTGSCDDMIYHTGTNVGKTESGHARYRYIEGLWDTIRTFCDGICFSTSTVRGIKNPNYFTEDTSGYGTTLLGSRVLNEGYISKWTQSTASGFEYAIFPSEFNGDNSTYVTDSFHGTNTSGVVLCVGNTGSYYGGGPFSINSNFDKSSSSSGSRLMKLP